MLTTLEYIYKIQFVCLRAHTFQELPYPRCSSGGQKYAKLSTLNSQKKNDSKLRDTWKV